MNKKSVLVILLALLIAIFPTSLTEETFSLKKEKPIYSVDCKNKEVCLTFDINWADKEYLYDILDVLKQNNVKATFFIMGKWVNYSKENVDKLKAIYLDGHEIGNHSYIHPLFTNISEERMISEIKKTEDIIYEKIGVKTKLFRCPSGAYNDTVINTVKSLGYYCIQWDVDSVDYKNGNAEDELKRVITNVKDGSIILFHNNAKNTPKNLQIIIETLKNNGFQLKTVSEVIYKNDYYIDSNGRQLKNNAIN